MTINDYMGRPYNLSDEVYELLKPHEMSGDKYPVGQRIRLISGVNGSPIPGYHTTPGHTTVCRVDAEIAEFLGIPKVYLKQVPA